MADGLETLMNKDYPGRFIIIGMPSKYFYVVAYGMTGRLALTKGRKLEEEGNCIFVRPKNKKFAKKLDPEIHLYPAIIWGKDGVAISNGKQTDAVHSDLQYAECPIDALIGAHEEFEYENDPPVYTSRISGCIKNGKAAMGIIKRGPEGTAERHYFEVPLIPGKGKLITTFDGPDVKIPPTFKGEPLDVNLYAIQYNIHKLANALYAAMPQKYVISLAVLDSFVDTGEKTIKILNK